MNYHHKLFTLSLALAVLLILGACQPTPSSQANPSATTASAAPTPAPGTPTVTAEPVTQPPGPTALPTASIETPGPANTVPTNPPSPTTPPTPPPSSEGAGNADVLHVRAVQADDGRWTFHVTVEHPDTGWEDYADGWDVVAPDGTVFKPDPDSPFTRLLLHPHETEQPFTRNQSGIEIPEGVRQVRVRAHDLVDGYGGREVLVDLTVAQGEDFEVEAKP